MSLRFKNWLVLSFATLFSTLLVWLPFFLHLHSFFGIPLNNTGSQTLVANFDGPYYIVVSKTFYRPDLIRHLFSFPLPLQYYTAHFPFFPLLIHFVSPFLGSGLGMLVATTLGTVLYTITIYELFLHENLNELALPAALLSLFLPARWLAVHSIGSPEPWFMFFILVSLISFTKKKYWLAGITGALATLTKSPGILLFAAFSLQSLHDIIVSKQKFALQLFGLTLVPLALLGLFSFFYFQTGDFFAYIHSGDNIHLQVLPFQVFNSHQPWVGSIWLEDIIYIFLLAGLGFITLANQKKGVITLFYGLFFATLLFVSHRDLARYSLPLVPLALLAFAPALRKNDVWKLLAFLFFPIYLYTLNFIAGNVLPIANWSPLL